MTLRCGNPGQHRFLDSVVQGVDMNLHVDNFGELFFYLVLNLVRDVMCFRNGEIGIDLDVGIDVTQPPHRARSQVVDADHARICNSIAWRTSSTSSKSRPVSINSYNALRPRRKPIHEIMPATTIAAAASMCATPSSCAEMPMTTTIDDNASER